MQTIVNIIYNLFRRLRASISAIELNQYKRSANGIKKELTKIALRGSTNRVGVRDDLFLQKTVKFVYKRSPIVEILN